MLVKSIAQKTLKRVFSNDYRRFFIVVVFLDYTQNLPNDFRVEPAYRSNVDTYKSGMCAPILFKKHHATRSCGICSPIVLDFLTRSPMRVWVLVIWENQLSQCYGSNGFIHS